LVCNFVATSSDSGLSGGQHYPFSNFIFNPCFPGPNDYVVDPESKRVLEEKIKLVFPLWEEEKRPGSGFFNQTVNIVVMFISLSYYVFP